MKPIRFYVAMILARLSYFMLKLIGRNATHFPGLVAVRICPNILKYLEVPNKVISITGTNGKTTTSNMIVSFLEANGVDLVANQSGSNIEGGIISALLTSTTFFGKNKKEMAVFEVDERASVYIFPYIKPDVIVVTNLYRDSYKRNAHVDYIVETLEKSIPKSSLLILNGDDTLTCNLCKNNTRKYFSIAPQDFEQEVFDSIIQDAMYCQNCGEKLIFDFKRYHHIGLAHCDKCGYKSPSADYLLTKITNEQIVIKEDNTEYPCQNSIRNITDNYNKLAAISALRALDYSFDKISTYFSKLKVVESRYNETVANDKRVVTILAKDQNPVANSRVFDFIRKQSSWGSISILFINEIHPHDASYISCENMAWLYDADFEYLNLPAVKQIFCMGHHNLEYKSRMLFAGIDADKIELLEPSNTLDIKTSTDTVIILHGTKNIATANKFKDILVGGNKN